MPHPAACCTSARGKSRNQQASAPVPKAVPHTGKAAPSRRSRAGVCTGARGNAPCRRGRAGAQRRGGRHSTMAVRKRCVAQGS
eukprot:4773254-Alexandrium_andersonii.AAC.1